MSVTDLLQQAIQLAGGTETLLGKATGYSQNAIWQAKRRGHVTPEMARAIHWAFDGRIPASSFRPDIWPTPDHVPPKPEDWAPAERSVA
jgi:hypothetical protein